MLESLTLQVPAAEVESDGVEFANTESTSVEQDEEDAASGPETVVDEQAAFAALGLDRRLLSTLEYTEPSPIQREAIPVLIAGNDIVGLAGTGTGKTAAFALPLLHRLHCVAELADDTEIGGGRKRRVRALILTPTRELATQVAQAVTAYGRPLGTRVLAVYGGTGYAEQVQGIRSGVEVVVATPGRALDLIQRGKLPLDSVETVILDEADEMLNMGFAEDMDAILSATPTDRQTMLFSATMPPRIEEIAQRHLREPVRIQVAKERPIDGEPARVRQTGYLVTRDNKAKALCRILDLEQPASAIIFVRMRSDADELVKVLNRRGFKPLALHGGLTQAQRDQVMDRFRAGTADLLVATDIAARGLDISHLSHVVNYDLPTDPHQYVHRIGRVGRAGRAGVAITLATSKERSDLGQIERLTKQKIALAPIPTSKDLQAARLDRTRSQLRDALSAIAADSAAAADLHRLVEELASESSPADVAVAALSLLRGPVRAEADDDKEFATGPAAREPREFDRKRSRTERHGSDDGKPGRPGRSEHGGRGRRPTTHGMSKLYFGIGRESGVAARDLVGAITSEARIQGKQIGSIDLADRFSLVEVPSNLADSIISAMQGLRMRGRKVSVRADRGASQPGGFVATAFQARG